MILFSQGRVLNLWFKKPVGSEGHILLFSQGVRQEKGHSQLYATGGEKKKENFAATEEKTWHFSFHQPLPSGDSNKSQNT